MQEDRWSTPRQLWLGDPKPIAREIKVQLARNDQRQADIMQQLGLKRQALARRLGGITKWSRSELEELAAFWGITMDDLTGTNGADFPAAPH